MKQRTFRRLRLRLVRRVALGLAVAAVAAPSAVAAIDEGAGPASGGDPAAASGDWVSRSVANHPPASGDWISRFVANRPPVAAAPARTAVERPLPPQGFRWAEAWVGAAVALGAIGLLALGLALRRSRVEPAH